MTEFRRTLLLVVLMMSLLMLFDKWRIYHGETSLLAPRPAATHATATPSAASAPAVDHAALAAAAASASGAASGAAANLPVQDVTIQTDVIKARMSTLGADLLDVDLLKYQDDDNHSEVWRQLKNGIARLFGRQIELPPAKADVKVFDTDTESGKFYAAQTGLAGLPGDTLAHGVMRLVSSERKLADGKDDLVVRFESPEVNGVQLVKTYTFHRGSYAIDVTHEVVNHSGAPIKPDLYLQLVRDGRKPEGGYLSGPSSYTGPAVYRDDTFHKIEFSDIDKAKAKGVSALDSKEATTNGWIAMIQHYFSSAWILPPGTARSYSVGSFDANVHGQPTYFTAMFTPVGTVAPGATQTVKATLFAGPQEEKLLAPLAPNLEQVKDYGRLKIIAQPLFWLLSRINTVVGNWGWSIVAMVFLLKIALYGLNANAYRSMAKMKAVSPRIQELNVRYKDNPQQKQQEIMKVYREEKVNPLGGCLPILIQMPIFFALFTVLTSSAEMRGAPWIGWIHDLSIMDPYAILPILMTATSLIQISLQPAPADPMQAKMMWMMPIAFSAALFSFPAGLTLYYVTNNALTILQQWLINRQIDGEKDKAGKVTDAKIVKS
jgi:YidC/Oxa1 family membrane protein insertase